VGDKARPLRGWGAGQLLDHRTCGQSRGVYVKRGVLRASVCVHMHTGHRIIDKLDGLYRPH